ncbi:hypothetical protein EYF80_046596 [Liparis tanakae]|uniref:Uncharacterized protein n=1 Tax=Liparis tanakae TaxID=230148 RepID=A0A4Z2FQ02_9TELE|nr:hypothetical protein EYF80_046596 [Liparis tanakae]
MERPSVNQEERGRGQQVSPLSPEGPAGNMAQGSEAGRGIVYEEEVWPLMAPRGHMISSMFT